MKKKREFNIFSLLWTLLLHTAVVGLLLLLHLNKPVAQAESGVPVLLGNMGNLDTDYEFTEVNSMPAPASSTVPVPQAEPNLTQNMEETIALESGDMEKTVQPVEEIHEPTPEEIRAEQERKAAEQAQSLMANAFGRSSTMQSTSEADNNTDVQDNPGSIQGNSTQGKPVGTGSYGTWDLGGRDMLGELPRPAYDGIQEEGRVVVAITVDPDGNVVGTRIHNRTNTANLQLRNAAEEAARRTKFNAVNIADNQTGTITYYFKLK